MNDRLEKFKEIWKSDPNKGIAGLEPVVDFDNFQKSIIGTGPFYSYIIDFETMTLSHVRESISDVLGLNPADVTFHDILESFHPDDLDFIAKAEAFGALFFYKNIKPAKLMRYKASFNFRIRLKDGSYGLFNHQALMLTLGKNGGYGKCLNIHTHIDHLTEVNNYRYSIISIADDPSFLNMKIDDECNNAGFSPKEIQILKLIAQGHSTNAIAEKIFVSPHTVKKHRGNILKKTDCKNMTELVKISYMNGLI